MMKAFYCYSCRKSFALRVPAGGAQDSNVLPKCFYCDSDFVEELSPEMTVQLLPILMHEQAVHMAHRQSPHVQVINPEASPTTLPDSNRTGGTPRPIPVPMQNLFQNLSESLRNMYNSQPTGPTDQPTSGQQRDGQASGSSRQYSWAVHAYGPEGFSVSISSPNINMTGANGSAAEGTGNSGPNDPSQVPSSSDGGPTDLEGILNLITQITGDDSVLQPMFRMFGLSGNPRDYVMTGQFEDLLDQFFRQHQPNLVGMSDEEIDRCLKKIDPADVSQSKGAEEGCAICKEDFITPQTDLVVRMLPCGHIFHNDCILPWLKRVASCPICRTNPLTEYEKQTK
jgi:hypothetical protein